MGFTRFPERKPVNRRVRFAAAAVAAAFWLLIWQIASVVINQEILLATPVAVFRSLLRMMGTQSFWQSIIFSLARIQAGFSLGLLAGLLLAILTAASVWAERILGPAIRAVRSTPVASFILLAMVWLSNQTSVVFIVFLMTTPIIWNAVLTAIRQTSDELLEMAAVYRVPGRMILWNIYRPSIRPFLISGATTAQGLGWKAGIAAEVLSRPRLSLGAQLYESKIYLETSELMAYTLVVILISLALERLLIAVARQKRGVSS